MRNDTRSGFTLIELSIVLVIIGLIVGGVLVGRDMIEAARVRKIVQGIDNYNLAINTFKLKYNCLPGDCPNAAGFGLRENGNGDGKINAAFFVLPSRTFYSFTANSTDNEGHKEEMTLLNEHLARAQLIGIPPFNRTASAPTRMTNSWYVTFFKPTESLMALTNGYSRDLIRLNSTQMFSGSKVIGFQSPSGGNDGMEIEKAFAIDSKIDDGLPFTGSVIQENTIGEANNGPVNDIFACATPHDQTVSDNTYNMSRTRHWDTGLPDNPVSGPCGLSFYNRF